VKEFDPVEYFDTVPEALNRTYNRPKKRDLENQSLILNKVISYYSKSPNQKKRMPELDQVRRQKERQYTELRERMKRSNQMKYLVQDLSIRKALVVFSISFIHINYSLD
jgi:hypothetical protein